MSDALPLTPTPLKELADHHRQDFKFVGEMAIAWNLKVNRDNTAENRQEYKRWADLFEKLQKQKLKDEERERKQKEREENLLKHAARPAVDRLLGDFVIDPEHHLIFRTRFDSHGAPKPTLVADFTMAVKSKRRDVSDPDSLSLVVELTNGLGHRKTVTLNPKAQTDARLFNEVAGDAHFAWHGSTEDLKVYNMQYVRTDDSPEVFTTHQVGIQRYAGRWVLVLPDRTLSLDPFTGDLTEHADFTWDGHSAYRDLFGSQLDLTSFATDAEKADISRYLLDFNHPQFAAAVVGWTVATFFKPRLRQIEEQFPILYLVSERSSGKTKAMEVAAALSGFSGLHLVNFQKSTAATCRDKQSLTTSFPIYYDEVKDVTGRDTSVQKRWKEMVNVLYNNEVAEKRGGANYSELLLFPQVAPVVGIGENAIVDASTLDRVLIGRTSPMLAQPHLRSYEELTRLPLGKVANELALWALTLTDEELAGQVRDAERLLHAKIVNRQRWNASLGLFGLRLLRDLLGAAWTDVELAGYIEAGFSLAENDGAITASSPVEQILDALREMASVHPDPNAAEGEAGDETKFPRYVWNNHLVEGLHYRRLDDADMIAYHMPACWPRLTAWLRETDQTNLLKDSRSTFLSQVRSTEHFVRFQTVRLGGESSHCLVVRLPQEPEDENDS